MSWYVFLMTDCDRKAIFCGRTADIEKACDYFGNMPCILIGKQLNRLVYLEIYEDEKESMNRFEVMTRLKRSEKNTLVETVNPSWQEMKPGVNIEL